MLVLLYLQPILCQEGGRALLGAWSDEGAREVVDFGIV